MSVQPALARFGLYGEGVENPAPEFLHLEPISSRSSLHQWTIAPHSHPRIHQLLLIEQGGAQLLADGADIALGPRSLVAIPSHCVHAFRFEPGTEGWVFSFAAEVLNDARLERLAQGDVYTRRSASVAWLDTDDAALGRLRWLLGDLATESAGGRAGGRSGGLAHPSARLVAQVGLVLAVAEEALAGQQAPTATDRQRALALAFQHLVNMRFRDGLAVGAYARELGASVPTLARACRTILQAPPGEVVRARVLLEALRHLTFTSDSLAAISDRLGFSDPAYFARFFKQRTGRTASQFRREGGWFDSK